MKTGSLPSDAILVCRRVVTSLDGGVPFTEGELSAAEELLLPRSRMGPAWGLTPANVDASAPPDFRSYDPDLEATRPAMLAALLGRAEALGQHRAETGDLDGGVYVPECACFSLTRVQENLMRFSRIAHDSSGRWHVFPPGPQPWHVSVLNGSWLH